MSRPFPITFHDFWRLAFVIAVLNCKLELECRIVIQLLNDFGELGLQDSLLSRDEGLLFVPKLIIHDGNHVPIVLRRHICRAIP